MLEEWVLTFTRWYNYEHKHSQLRFVTPHQRHTGQDKAILMQRERCLEKAKQAAPSRWVVAISATVSLCQLKRNKWKIRLHDRLKSDNHLEKRRGQNN